MIEKIVQEMVNCMWRMFPRDFDGDRSQFDFQHQLDNKFPDLKFTFNSPTDEWLLLTDLMTL